jgi:polysaccharide biosynthesis/export protein
MQMKKFSVHWISGLALALAGILLAGCDTTDSGKGNYTYDPTQSDAPPAAIAGPTGAQAPPSLSNDSSWTLRVGDDLIVSFADLGINTIPPIEDQIKSDGTITLIYDQKFEAAGKTLGQLQKEIRARYVPKYFVNMTPSIKVQDRYFVVTGEVKTPNRFLWSGQMTVLGAISTAGGFTDFSKKSNVRLTRANGEQLTEDCGAAIKHPEKDLPVYAGDLVYVHKRLW